MPTGTCGLCHTVGVELIDSHYMPSALYKIARSPAAKNPHPVLIGGGKARLSPKQASDHFLCTVCEDRFNKSGEAWVQANCWRDENTFKLREKLLAHGSIPGGDERTKIFEGAKLPGIECEQLAYFGASVFWRGAARSWSIDGASLPRLRFNVHEEQFRLYLLDHGPFPAKAVMWILVSAGMESMRNNVAQFPGKISTNGSYIYRLRIPGITYLLMLGGRFRDQLVTCSVKTSERFIYMHEDNDKWNFEDAIGEYADSQRVGALKDRLVGGPGVPPPRWTEEEIRNLLPKRTRK